MPIVNPTDDATSDAPASAPGGGIQIEAFSCVRGWVGDIDGAGPRTVTLSLNGENYWTGAADRLEHPEFNVENPRSPCGFSITLPAPITRPHLATVSLIVDGEVVATAEADLSKRYSGFLDKVEVSRDGLLVAGWAHDAGRPLDPVKLDIHLSGRLLCTVTASQQREDLAQAKIGLGNHAFSELVLIQSAQGSVADAVAIAIAGTEIVLESSNNPIEDGHDSETAGAAVQRAIKEPPLRDRKLAEIVIKPPEASIAGVCDKISDEEVFGWAVDLQDKEKPVVLDLLVNNLVVATTQTERYRADIADKYGMSGFAGFHFEIIPQMRLGRVLNVAIVARKTGAVLPHGYKTIRPAFTKYLPPTKAEVGELAAGARIRENPFETDGVGSTGELAPSAALIVLNKDGAALLDRHFETFWTHNTYRNVGHVIVDHGSTDGSKSVVERWKAKGLEIKFIERRSNYSFSSSNNFALRYTDAEYLVFCNNDVFFTKDVLPELMRVLNRKGVGIASIKLMDESKFSDADGPPIIQHLGVFYNPQKYDRVVHPVEARYLPILESKLNTNFEVPSVSGAFLGISRDDFQEAGGFHEGYFYGYEDIDLCLTMKLRLRKNIFVAATVDALHSRGYSRKKAGIWGGSPMLRNSRLLSSRFGLSMRRLLRRNLFRGHEFWTATKPIIAFAVSEASETTIVGDFYTAYELALELSKLVDATIVFLEEHNNWYDVREVDLLVAMTHNYNLSFLKDPKQNLVTVGWARNWISDWAKPRDQDFDMIMSSSGRGADTIRKGNGHTGRILRIATNPGRFFPGTADEKTVDYVFTGNFWGHARDLIYFLEPAALPFICEIYGSGWEQIEHLAPYAKGFANYDDLAGIYRRARVVIDDANSVTKEWGSVNSRVFDAISSGALVITNSAEASKDGFDGELPFFDNREQLEALLRKYCGSEEERVAKLTKLQAIVAEKHSYGHRARQLIEYVDGALQSMLRIAIKVPCPSSSESHLWGDYHFAQSLARELRALGHSVRLDSLDRWYDGNRLRDDAVICLRGLSQYAPTLDQINICWLISHPDTVSVGELRAYDRVYVASASYCEWLRRQGLDNVEVLLQCVDTDLFSPANFAEPGTGFDVLFVGNSRNKMRRVIRDAIAVNAPLTIIGSGWEGLVPPECILQNSVPHRELPRLYSSARVVLNDHWESMAERGFLSNRLFECVAAGAYVISDDVEGISDVFGPLVKRYRSRSKLGTLIEQGLNDSPHASRDKQLAKSVSEANSFTVRAKVVSDFLAGNFEEICQQRSAPGESGLLTKSSAPGGSILRERTEIAR